MRHMSAAVDDLELRHALQEQERGADRLHALRLHAADTQVPVDLLSVADPKLEVTVWASTPWLASTTRIEPSHAARLRETS